MNKVILLGRVGQQPEVKVFDNGGKIANFSLATDESYKDREGNKVEKTEWHRIVFQNKLADVAERFFQKGQQLMIEGKIRTRKYQASDGSDRYTTEIIGFGFEFCGSKSDNQSTVATSTPATPATEPEGDLPF